MKVMITTSLIAPLYMYNIMVKGHYDINEMIITSLVASLYMVRITVYVNNILKLRNIM